MDTNIIGRLKIHGEPEKNKTSINRIVVLDLTPETKGNAYGIGLSDFTTRTLVDKIDYNVTYTNAITSTFTERVKIPIIAKDEDEAFEMAIKACGIQEINNIRAIRIKNTLELDEIWVSPAVYREIKLKNGE
jgi:preprotein translocase subunit SecB